MRTAYDGNRSGHTPPTRAFRGPSTQTPSRMYMNAGLGQGMSSIDGQDHQGWDSPQSKHLSGMNANASSWSPTAGVGAGNGVSKWGSGGRNGFGSMHFGTGFGNTGVTGHSHMYGHHGDPFCERIPIIVEPRGQLPAEVQLYHEVRQPSGLVYTLRGREEDRDRPQLKVEFWSGCKNLPLDILSA